MQLSPLPGKQNSLVKMILRGWTPLHSTRADMAELDRCGTREVERMAQDLSFFPRDLRDMVERGAHAPTLLPHRIAALHLDIEHIGRVQPKVLCNLRKICATCESKAGACETCIAPTISMAFVLPGIMTRCVRSNPECEMDRTSDRHVQMPQPVAASAIVGDDQRWTAAWLLTPGPFAGCRRRYRDATGVISPKSPGQN